MHSALRLLVRPLDTWHKLGREPKLAPVLLAQAIISLLGALLAAKSYALIAGEFSLDTYRAGFWGLLQLLFTTLLVVLALDVLWACLLGLAAILLGIRLPLRQAFLLSAYALLPVIFGQFLGQVALAIAQFIPATPAEALALRMRPFPLGAALLPLPGLEPLSFGWFMLAYFDLFMLWSLLMIWLGLRHYAGLNARDSAWLLLVLVLSLALGLTGLWKGLQAVVSF